MRLGSRSKARHYALQLVYQLHPRIEANQLPEHETEWQDLFRNFWDRTGEVVDPEVVEFCERLVRGVACRVVGIDERLAKHADNWKLSRMARVDLSVLRLGAYELMDCPDVPLEVALDEAVELAKRFSTQESPSFVNGILDRLAKATRTSQPLEAASA